MFAFEFIRVSSMNHFAKYSHSPVIHSMGCDASMMIVMCMIMRQPLSGMINHVV
jgi:hypothetical protein